MLEPAQKLERIAKALESGGCTHSLQDVLGGLREGRFQIFDNDHGVCISEIIQTPQCRYLNCFVVAGQLPGVMELHNEVEEFAKANDCKWLETTARLGWEKVLPGFGWKKARVVFIREVA